MALDLLKVEPHKVKAGVQGKMFMFYGGAKVGKTTVACQFSKPLLLAFIFSLILFCESNSG